MACFQSEVLRLAGHSLHLVDAEKKTSHNSCMYWKQRWGSISKCTLMFEIHLYLLSLFWFPYDKNLSSWVNPQKKSLPAKVNYY